MNQDGLLEVYASVLASTELFAHFVDMGFTLSDVIVNVGVGGVHDDVIELVQHGPADVKRSPRFSVADKLFEIREVDEDDIGVKAGGVPVDPTAGHYATKSDVPSGALIPPARDVAKMLTTRPPKVLFARELSRI